MPEKSGRLFQILRSEGFEDAYPSQLSGGMRQRLSAQNLSLPSDIMMLDDHLVLSMPSQEVNAFMAYEYLQ